MDPPDKSPHLPAGRPASTRRMPSPPERVALAPAPGGLTHASGRSQTTLPPIHYLHPGLAHSSMQPPPQPPRAGSPFAHGATHPLASTSALGVRPAPEDSDPETSQGRPKQKRRRQALSCTECKRRKIKCDRANPCGPCVRRGEQAKCQWHVIEPMEKYVTRSEFDELKARVQELESALMRALSGASPPAPTSRRPSIPATMSMSSGHPTEPVHGTAVMPYQAYSAAPVAPYPARPGSPRSPARGSPRHTTVIRLRPLPLEEVRQSPTARLRCPARLHARARACNSRRPHRLQPDARPCALLRPAAAPARARACACLPPQRLRHHLSVGHPSP
ncbi:hypothetical protein BD414DRAFT_570706 [Trametes punicea]|nr:hypothetical protein BD414DRAFT_570706 [Trametes punicea]